MADGANRENIITILGSYSDVGEPIILSIGNKTSSIQKSLPTVFQILASFF